MNQLLRLGLQRLYPFDSLRSLRVTTTYIHCFKREPRGIQPPKEAVEFYKLAFITFGFFGTPCTRPVTKSKISTRASNGPNFHRAILPNEINNNYHALRIAFKFNNLNLTPPGRDPSKPKDFLYIAPQLQSP